MENTGKGYIQIYTGNGKGKTTAAMGLAARAAGSGIQCRIVQFMKGMHSGERDFLAGFKNIITIENYGEEDFVKSGDSDSIHSEKAQSGLSRAKEIISSGFDGLLILDEIITAVNFNLIKENEIIDIMKNKPEKMELVLTGRDAGWNLIAGADLVTEMKCIKHYYDSGVKARRGIEF